MYMYILFTASPLHFEFFIFFLSSSKQYIYLNKHSVNILLSLLIGIDFVFASFIFIASSSLQSQTRAVREVRGILS